jgi:hypothetical protein
MLRRPKWGACLLLLIVSASLWHCTTRPAVQVEEPSAGLRPKASKQLFGAYLNQALPVSGRKLESLLRETHTPSACAALYQLVLSKGVDASLVSWQRRELNFSAACLPELAKSAFLQCPHPAQQTSGAVRACLQVLSFVRSSLVERLFAGEEHPTAQLWRGAHQLYLGHPQLEKNWRENLALIERVLKLRRDELDAHLLRALVLAPHREDEVLQQAYAASLRWLELSAEKRHKQALLYLELYEAHARLESNPGAFRDLERVVERTNGTEAAWSLRAKALEAYYRKQPALARGLLAKAAEMQDADAELKRERDVLEAGGEHPFTVRSGASTWL